MSEDRVAEPVLPRIARNEPTAVAEFMTRYGGLVWHLARRICPDDAEDAVQEVFIELWKNAAAFDGQRSSEPTFVSMIARRRLIDRRRKRLREPTRVALGDALHEPVEISGDRLEEAEEAVLIGRYFDRLPAVEQQVLRLAIEQNQSHSQIAQLLELPLGTVKSHARRGLLKLREWLQAASIGGEVK